MPFPIFYLYKRHHCDKSWAGVFVFHVGGVYVLDKTPGGETVFQKGKCIGSCWARHCQIVLHVIVPLCSQERRWY